MTLTGGEEPTTPHEEPVRVQIQRWRDDLINLARSNRLLFYKPTRTSTLELLAPEVNAVLQRLREGSRRSWTFFLPEEPPRDEALQRTTDAHDWIPRRGADELLTTKLTSKEVESALRTLQRRSNQEFIDRGLWILYLAAGALHWADADQGDNGIAPLLLVPVLLERENPRVPYRLVRADEEASFNPALGVRLERMNVKLPDLEEEVEALDFGNITAAVERAVRGMPGWSVSQQMALATFSFHKEAMYRDLLDHEDEIASHEVIRGLALGPDADVDLTFDEIPEERLDAEAPPEELVSIRDTDSTQRQAIAAARRGRSFVLDGPPGTGKSQTIANTIAELIATGKSVLFVSEKAAALEVVHQRLAEAGLAAYLLELHSHKATRKEVAQELGRALQTRPVAHGSSKSDADRARSARDALSEYAVAMNERRESLGRSLHDAIGRITQLQHVPHAPVAVDVGKTVNLQRFQSALETARGLARSWGPVARGDDFAWYGLTERDWSAGEESHLLRLITNLRRELESLRTADAEVAAELGVRSSRDLADSNTLADFVDLLAHRDQDIPGSWLTSDEVEPVRDRIEQLASLTQACRENERAAANIVGERWRDLNPEDASIVDEHRAHLKGLLPQWVPDGSSDLQGLLDQTALIDETARIFAIASSRFNPIAEAFGPNEVNVERAIEMAELAGLASTATPPEEHWLLTLDVDQLFESSRVLEVLVTRHRQHRSSLAEVFDEAVLQLDLGPLCDRVESTRWFRRLGASARQDRRTVRSVARTGKANKATLARLREALEWQRTSNELAGEESRRADALGTHYYRHTDTDFDQLDGALEVARRALALAGGKLDKQRIASQLSRTGALDAEVAEAGSTLHRMLTSWRDRLHATIPELARALVRLHLEEIARWATDVGPSVGGLAAELRQSSRTTQRDLTLDEALAALGARRAVADAEAAIASTSETDARLLGPAYQGLFTDWASLRAAREWAWAVREFSSGPVEPWVAEAFLSPTVGSQQIRDQQRVVEKAVEGLVSEFETERQPAITQGLRQRYDDVEALLSLLAESIADVQEWLAFRSALRALETDGLQPVTDFCLTERIAAATLPDVIERSLLEGWVDAQLGADPRLHTLRAKDRDALVDEFQELDRQLIRAASTRVIEACNARRPQNSLGQAGIIQREAQKKTRHMPVRTLLEKAGGVAQDLKPCFMMSPLTVSQFLPPALRFDTVIFDEASQVRPADAVNCIYRGHQLIVAGDQKQLPPTSFFDRVDDGDDEYDEDEPDSFESVLDLCKAAGWMKSLPLLWHYRSQHEDLITYSNYRFYTPLLYTFPSRDDAGHDLGLELFKVDGVYRRGGSRDNQVEAIKVVERIFFHAERHPNLSLGVVTFSESQAACIEMELEQHRRGRPDLDGYFGGDRLDGFFVKSLEAVQGDERDIIIFSIGYGPDEVGKLTLNFGPLNRKLGWRRLNVAITRARRRVEIVSSIRASDLRGDITNEGVGHLRGYLDFAERGIASLAVDMPSESRGDAESPFEEEVARVIASWGYTPVPQVGHAGFRVDIGVRHPVLPNTYALGVECDGAMYHQSKTARDRDRLRQEVLERLGWTIHRIWGPAWYRARKAEEERLREAIEAAVTSSDTRSTPPSPAAATPLVRLEDVDLTAPPLWAVPYRKATGGMPTAYRALEPHDPGARDALESVIRYVIQAEGPVSQELVARRVRDAWERHLISPRTREAVEMVLRRLVRAGVLIRDSGFLWLPGSELREVRVPVDGDPDTERRVDDVPPAELALALELTIRDVKSIEADELTRRVAAIFGWRRRGPDIESALRSALRGLERSGSIVRNGTEFLPSNP